jgi:hypothetical protein
MIRRGPFEQGLEQLHHINAFCVLVFFLFLDFIGLVVGVGLRHSIVIFSTLTAALLSFLFTRRSYRSFCVSIFIIVPFFTKVFRGTVPYEYYV